MKVLMVIDSVGLGGKERQAVELAKGLVDRKGFKLYVAVLGERNFYSDRLDKIEARVEYGLRRKRFDLNACIRLFAIFREFRPDIVHTNSWIATLACFPITKLLGARLVNGSIRNAFRNGRARWKIERFLLKRSDCVVANSLAGLKSRGFIHDCSKNFVVYNGFDFSRIGFAPRKRLGTCKTVGMVAEFSNYKDYETYLLAANQLIRERSDIVCLAVGDGINLEKCKKMASGIDRIRFLGRRKDVEEVVESLDVGVLATFTEGISNSIMEYMALGKPVVATKGSGSDEIVVDGVTGFLVNRQDPEDLADKIRFLLDNPRIAERQGNAGRRRIKECFSLIKMIDRMQRVYEHVLEFRNKKYEAL